MVLKNNIKKILAIGFAFALSTGDGEAMLRRHIVVPRTAGYHLRQEASFGGKHNRFIQCVNDDQVFVTVGSRQAESRVAKDFVAEIVKENRDANQRGWNQPQAKAVAVQRKMSRGYHTSLGCQHALRTQEVAVAGEVRELHPVWEQFEQQVNAVLSSWHRRGASYGQKLKALEAAMPVVKQYANVQEISDINANALVEAIIATATTCYVQDFQRQRNIWEQKLRSDLQRVFGSARGSLQQRLADFIFRGSLLVRFEGPAKKPNLSKGYGKASLDELADQLAAMELGVDVEDDVVDHCWCVHPWEAGGYGLAECDGSCLGSHDSETGEEYSGDEEEEEEATSSCDERDSLA